MPHISLAAEKLWTFWGFPVTNSLLTTWLVMGMLFLFSYLVTKKMTIVPGVGQSIAELIIGGLYDFFHGVIGDNIKRAFPLLASLFLFIILANWVGLLPGVGTVGFFRSHVVAEAPIVPSTGKSPAPQESDDHGEAVKEGLVGEEAINVELASEKEETEFVPLLRGATADLNTTLALAVVAVIAIQYFGFVVLGRHYGSRFLDFRSPIFFFVGLLEIISDVSKIISFAFRLFGNIFAGEVLLAVMAFLMPFIVPLPFLMLELFVGFVQALVFSMLTAVFLNVALSHGEGGHEVAAHT